MGRWMETHPEPCTAPQQHGPQRALALPCARAGHPRTSRDSPSGFQAVQEQGSVPSPLSSHPGCPSCPLTFLPRLVDSLVRLDEDPGAQRSQHHLLRLGDIQGISLDGDVEGHDFLLPSGGGWSLRGDQQARGEDKDGDRGTQSTPSPRSPPQPGSPSTLQPAGRIIPAGITG